MLGAELLQKPRVPFNTLTTVNMEYPLEVYGFLRELTDYMQFLPVAGREAVQFEEEDGQLFAVPPRSCSVKIKHPVNSFSVIPA